jgi:hypothetical protein
MIGGARMKADPNKVVDLLVSEIGRLQKEVAVLKATLWEIQSNTDKVGEKANGDE